MTETTKKQFYFEGSDVPTACETPRISTHAKQTVAARHRRPVEKTCRNSRSTRALPRNTPVFRCLSDRGAHCPALGRVRPCTCSLCWLLCHLCSFVFLLEIMSILLSTNTLMRELNAPNGAPGAHAHVVTGPADLTCHGRASTCNKG